MTTLAINQTKRLSESEEKELFEQYLKTKDIDTRNQIIESFLPIVHHIASKVVSCNNVDYDDLVSCGYLGLIDAVERFDIGKGYRFLTFAYKKIQYSIQESSIKKNYLSKHIKNVEYRIERAKNSLLKKNKDVEITDDLLLKELDVKPSTLKDWKNKISKNSVKSLDAPIAQENETSNLIDLIESDTVDLDSEIDKKDKLEKIKTIVSVFKKSEIEIFYLYYFDNLTLRDIEKKVEVSSSFSSKVIAKIKKVIQWVLCEDEKEKQTLLLKYLETDIDLIFYNIEIRDKIIETLEHLEMKEKQILKLKYFDNKAIGEISKLLNLNVTYIYKEIKIGLEKVKIHLLKNKRDKNKTLVNHDNQTKKQTISKKCENLNLKQEELNRFSKKNFDEKELKKVKEIINALKELDKKTFSLYYFNNLSFKKIESRLKKSESTLRRIIIRVNRLINWILNSNEEIKKNQLIEYLNSDIDLVFYNIELRDTLKEILKTLNKKSRKVIEFYYFEHKSIEQIGEILKINSRLIYKEIKNSKIKIKEFLLNKRNVFVSNSKKVFKQKRRAIEGKIIKIAGVSNLADIDISNDNRVYECICDKPFVNRLNLGMFVLADTIGDWSKYSDEWQVLPKSKLQIESLQVFEEKEKKKDWLDKFNFSKIEKNQVQTIKSLEIKKNQAPKISKDIIHKCTRINGLGLQLLEHLLSKPKDFWFTATTLSLETGINYRSVYRIVDKLLEKGYLKTISKKCHIRGEKYQLVYDISGAIK